MVRQYPMKQTKFVNEVVIIIIIFVAKQKQDNTKSNRFCQQTASTKKSVPI